MRSPHSHRPSIYSSPPRCSLVFNLFVYPSNTKKRIFIAKSIMCVFPIMATNRSYVCAKAHWHTLITMTYCNYYVWRTRISCALDMRLMAQFHAHVLFIYTFPRRFCIYHCAVPCPSGISSRAHIFVDLCIYNLQMQCMRNLCQYVVLLCCSGVQRGRENYKTSARTTQAGTKLELSL